MIAFVRPEDRATRGRDPSAGAGAKTDGLLIFPAKTWNSEAGALNEFPHRPDKWMRKLAAVRQSNTPDTTWRESCLVTREEFTRLFKRMFTVIEGLGYVNSDSAGGELHVNLPGLEFLFTKGFMNVDTVKEVNGEKASSTVLVEGIEAVATGNAGQMTLLLDRGDIGVELVFQIMPDA